MFPDSKVHGANMGPIWGRQDPGGPHVGPIDLAIWVDTGVTIFRLSMVQELGLYDEIISQTPTESAQNVPGKFRLSHKEEITFINNNYHHHRETITSSIAVR